jgi:hypothetical protein
MKKFLFFLAFISLVNFVNAQNLPTVTQLNDISACPGMTINVPAFTSNLTGTTYSWINSNTAIGLGGSGTGDISSWTAPANGTGVDIMGTITVTPSLNGFTGVPMSFTVIIYPIPTVTQISNITVCPGDIISIPAFTSNLTGTTYSWTNNNTAIGLGGSGTGNISSWTAPANGTNANITGTITVTSSLNGCVGPAISFDITVCYPNGIENDNLSSHINIYPNPANDNITIEKTTFNNIKDAIISIYNIQGQLLIQQPLRQTKTEINILKLAKGLYILKIGSQEGIKVKRFIKE